MWHRAGEIVRVAGPEHAALRANRQLDAAEQQIIRGWDNIWECARRQYLAAEANVETLAR